VLPSIRKLAPQLKIIFDTVDIHFLRLEREYAVTSEPQLVAEAARFRKLELQLTSLSEQVWCVTPKDKEVLEREVPAASIKVIPNIHVLHPGGQSFLERQGLLFIGNFNHRPNQDALRWYRDEILPHLRQLLPEVKLFVVGSNMSDAILAYASEHIVIKGFVPNVSPLFETSRLFISPLRYGSGMKGKVGHALSYGLPVVTTSIGAEGFKFKAGHDAMIADEPAAFAEAVREAYTHKELWQRLSQNGYQHVGDHFTPQIVTRKIVAAIEELNSGAH
jgi:glycosyltransferase involved in cell wall biosynthesis